MVQRHDIIDSRPRSGIWIASLGLVRGISSFEFDWPFSALLVAVITLGWSSGASALGWFGSTLEGTVCDGRGQGFGPYDYFDIDEPGDALYEEGRHWEIKKLHRDRALWAMQQVQPIDFKHYAIAAAEIDYTLRAIPNEPVALQYKINLEMMRRADPTSLRSSFPPPECYFQRAIAFRPGQEHLYLLYGIYLNKIGRHEDEMEQYSMALSVNPKSAEAHYNMALALLKSDRPEEALGHARQAYDLGFPLQGVRKRLKRLGYNLDLDLQQSPHTP